MTRQPQAIQPGLPTPTPKNPNGATTGREHLGYVFPLLLLWLFYEFGRPAHPLGVPLLISGVAFASWVVARDKQWQPFSIWWLVLLLVMAIGIPLAGNTYAAFWGTKGMAVLFIAICLPLQAQLNTVHKIRIWIYAFLAVTFYVGAWAATHGGFGPSASGGGQDENYIAAMMGMSIGMAYFSLVAERRMWVKAILIVAMLVYLAAIAKAQNPSRGGFLGLCAVAVYCAGRAPRKRVAFGVLALLGGSLLAIAGPAFWAEIRTTTDYQTGTGDERIEVWKAGLRMWEGNPVLGVGAGNFRWAIGDYQSAEQFAKFGRSLGGSIIAHSLPVELVAELGSAGLVATVALVWGAWRLLGKVHDAAKASDPSLRDFEDRRSLGLHADALRAGILAILVNGVFLSLLYFSYLWVLIAAGSAVGAVWRRLGAANEGSRARNDRLPRHRRASAVGPVLTPGIPNSVPMTGQSR